MLQRLFIFLMICLVSLTPPALRQVAAQNLGASSAEASMQEQNSQPPVAKQLVFPAVSASQLLADQWVLLARKVLSSSGQPTAEQLLCSRILLEQAVKTQPDDTEVWLLLVEIGRRMNDLELQRTALKRYCALTPSDDAAQFDLILAGLTSSQTIEQRSAMLQRLLDNPASEKLSTALRSRLASQIAVWAKEIGDYPTLSTRLTQAIRLDGSNRQAAALLAQWTQSSNAGPAQKAVAYMAWMTADPLDIVPRTALADILFAEKNYADAAVQYRSVQRIAAVSMPLSFYRQWTLSLLRDGKPDQAMELLIAWDQMNRPSSTANAPVKTESSSSPTTATSSPMASGSQVVDLPADSSLATAVLSLPAELEEVRLQAVAALAAQPAANPADPSAASTETAAKAGPVEPPTELGKTLHQKLRDLVVQVREPDPASQRWIQFQTHFADSRWSYLEPIQGKIILKNQTSVPLALAPQGPVPTQVILYLSGRQSGQDMGTISPMVISLRRQLVIAPRSSIEVPIRLDRAEFGLQLSDTPLDRCSFSGMFVLDPQIIEESQVTPGPLGDRATLPQMDRFGSVPSGENLTAWWNSLNHPNESVQMQAIAWMSQTFNILSTIPEVKENVAQMVQQLIQTFPKTSVAMQAWTVRYLLGESKNRSRFSRIAEAAQKSNEPSVRMMYLLSLSLGDGAASASSVSAAIDAAIQSPDPTISQFARAWKVAKEQMRTSQTKPATSPGKSPKAQPAQNAS